jgi:hypothetical protein
MKGTFSQAPGESVDSFISELKEKMNTCEFENTQR